MANTPNWFPPATGDHQQDENWRTIFENVYSLKQSINGAGSSNNSTAETGMSVTMTFVDGNNTACKILIGGKQYSSLTFANGLLKGTR